MSKPNQVCVEQRCNPNEGEAEHKTEHVEVPREPDNESRSKATNLSKPMLDGSNEDRAEEIPLAQQQQPKGSTQDEAQNGDKPKSSQTGANQFDLKEASGEQFKKSSNRSSLSNT